MRTHGRSVTWPGFGGGENGGWPTSWDSPGSAGGWKWCWGLPVSPRMTARAHTAASDPRQPQTHGSLVGLPGRRGETFARRMYSDQWGVLISMVWFPLCSPTAVPPSPLLHLRAAKPDLLQRREEKATSPRAVNIRALHLPSVLKDRRWGNPSGWSRWKCPWPIWSLSMVKTTFTVALYFVCKSQFLFFFPFQHISPHRVCSNIYFQRISVKFGWEECQRSSAWRFLCPSSRRAVGNLLKWFFDSFLMVPPSVLLTVNGGCSPAHKIPCLPWWIGALQLLTFAKGLFSLFWAQSVSSSV